MPKLLIQLRGDPPKSLLLDDDMITIGRSNESMVVLDHESVSGQHARIERKNGRYFVSDVGSSNGTVLNGNPIQTAELTSGDCVRFGTIEAILSWQLAPQSAIYSSSSRRAPSVVADRAAPGPSIAAKVVLWGMDVGQNIQRNARIGILTAKIEKLKLIDLNKAYYELGKKCHGLKLHEDKFLSERAAITNLESRIKVNRNGTVPVDVDTTVAKATHAAEYVKGAAKVRALSIKLRRLHKQFGELLWKSGHHLSLPMTELKSVEKASADIQAHSDARARLNKRHPQKLTHGWKCTATLIILGGMSLWVFVGVKTCAHRAARQVEQVAVSQEGKVMTESFPGLVPESLIDLTGRMKDIGFVFRVDPSSNNKLTLYIGDYKSDKSQIEIIFFISRSELYGALVTTKVEALTPHPIQAQSAANAAACIAMGVVHDKMLGLIKWHVDPMAEDIPGWPGLEREMTWGGLNAKSKWSCDPPIIGITTDQLSVERCDK